MGIFSAEDGAASKTAYIAEGSYTFEMADTYRDGVCCQYGAGEFKITVNGEPVGRYRVSRPVLLLPRPALKEVTEFGYFSSHSAGLVPVTSF
jgi:hypothetical protein